jgi:hypothetical protein
VYAELSSVEFCRTSVFRTGDGSVDRSVDGSLIGGSGADLLVLLRLNPVGIEGAGRVGRALPFSDVGVDGSAVTGVFSTFESSEWTLTFESSRYLRSK